MMFLRGSDIQILQHTSYIFHFHLIMGIVNLFLSVRCLSLCMFLTVNGVSCFLFVFLTFVALQETQLTPHWRNIQDLLCDSSMHLHSWVLHKVLVLFCYVFLSYVACQLTSFSVRHDPISWTLPEYVSETPFRHPRYGVASNFIKTCGWSNLQC